MKIFEEALQNMKKRRAENVAEMTDYDHFRADIFYKNSIARMKKTKYLESIHRIGHTIDFPDNKLARSDLKK